MKKQILIPALCVIAFLISFYMYESKYTDCKISQIYFKGLNTSEVKISFNTDYPVDSFKLGQIVFETGCAAGTLEENASWVEKNYRTSVKEIRYNPDGVTQVSTTINCNYLQFYDCESADYIYIPVVIFTHSGIKEITLKTCTNDLKTEFI
ncbi:MAG: hypothetical protein WAV23_02495 [Minisyncoccia bacterium]